MTMEEDQRKLFCPIEGKPMQFAIVLHRRLLQIELLRVLTNIEKEGGEFVGFDLENNNQINLTSKHYEPDKKNPVDNARVLFDISYIKKCVNKKMLLDLQVFQLYPKTDRSKDCFWMDRILFADRCRHLQTAKTVLKIMKTHKPKKNKEK